MILLKVFNFDFSILQTHQVLHPRITTTAELWAHPTTHHPPRLPLLMDSPNLQLLLANTKTSPGILFDKERRYSKYDQIRIVK